MTTSSGKRQQPLQAPWETTAETPPSSLPEQALESPPESPQPPPLPTVEPTVVLQEPPSTDALLATDLASPEPDVPTDDDVAAPTTPSRVLGPIFLTLVLCLLSGFLGGLFVVATTSHTLQLRMRPAEQDLAACRQQKQALEQALHDKTVFNGHGQLKNVDRNRHEQAGKHYALTLRRTQAQGAAELMVWFINRWDQLLDFPQADDRIGRRAATLALLVGGMAENLNEGDFVPWQAEFLNGDWLGELHFDMDGDGLPGKRSALNTHDGFANVSICHVAMALNQAMRDARVLMMPNMRCDRPEARMSIFLQGKTFDQALNVFVKQVREQGFLVVEKYEAKVRLVLVGARRHSQPPT